MKKLLFVFSFLASLLFVQPVSATLFSYYKEQGKSLPTCAERKVIALREYQMKNYSCSVEDNNLLESKLRGQSGLSPEVTYWIDRIKNNATKPLTKEELNTVPDEAWNEVTPQLIQFVTQGGEDNVGGSEVTHSIICRGHECDKYLKGNEVVGFSVATSYRTTLSSSMSSSQTFVPVSSLLTKDGTTLTMALLGGKVFLTEEPGSSREEITKCTTIASSQFTNCTRGLAFSGTSESAVAANAKAHNAGSIVIMSNVHYVYDQLTDKDSAEDVGGIKRFTSSTIKVGDGTATNNKIIYGDNGTASLPFLRYNESIGRWQFSDNGSDTVSLATSSAAGLSASTSLGIGISDSLIYVNASSTTGMSFGVDGKLYQKVSSTLAVASDSNGIYIVTSTLVSLISTSTPAINTIISTPVSSSVLSDGFINSSTLAGTISNIQNFISGESINASSVPQAVYFSNNDNTVHKLTSATASTTIFDFVGFAILGQNVATSSIIKVQIAGLVDGFSSLSTSSYYYGTDTSGTVSTTAGTVSYQVGVATKNTQLLIRKGRKTYNGTTTFSATATTSIVIGFRPSRVRIHASSASSDFSQGGWSANGGNNTVYIIGGGGVGAETNAWRADEGSNARHQGTVTTLTNSGFILSNTKTNSPGTVSIFWEAED